MRGNRAALILRADVAAERLRQRVKNARTAGALTLSISVDEVDSYAAAIENVVSIAKVSYTHDGAENTDAPPSPPLENPAA